LQISRHYGLPWIADFRDPLYGNPSRNRSWGWIWDAPIDRLIMSQASAVIANTDAAAQMLIARYPQYSKKIHLIWNGYDPEQLIGPRPIPQRTYKLLVHTGSLYGQRHPTLLLASLHRLISKGLIDSSRVRVRLVGEFERRDAWLTQSKFEELVRMGCIEYTEDAVPAHDALREMAEADYLLLLDLNDRGLGLQVPAKLFEYIQIGRPILAFTGKNSAVQRILARSEVPYICLYQDSDPAYIDAQILEFLAMPSEPVRPHPWFYDSFDANAQAGALAKILNSVCQTVLPQD
jgi:glycosyltransferase involved in cell wall biosynthesis